MSYKISGTKNETARIIIFKESDWSIESNTVVSGSGSYEVLSLESGIKMVIAESTSGEMLGYGNVSSAFYVPPGGQRGVFGGGGTPTNDFYDIMDYITINSISNASDFGDLTQARRAVGACSNGSSDRSVWGGGSNAANPDINTNVIDYVTILILGDATDFGDLTQARRGLAGTSNGTNDRGVFGGGYASNYSNTIDYITISSTGNATYFGVLANRYRLAATSNATNDRGILAGGQSSGGNQNTIDYITISSTGDATDFGDFTSTITNLAGCSNGTNNRGCFGSCYYSGSSTNIIEYITISTTGNAQDFGDLTTNRSVRGSTSNGVNDRGVWGGGTSNYNIIDYITISTTGNASDFGDLTVSRWGLAATSNA